MYTYVKPHWGIFMLYFNVARKKGKEAGREGGREGRKEGRKKERLARVDSVAGNQKS